MNFVPIRPGLQFNPCLAAFKRPWHWNEERARGRIEKDLLFFPLPHPQSNTYNRKRVAQLCQLLAMCTWCAQICTQDVYKRKSLDDYCHSRQPWPQMSFLNNCVGLLHILCRNFYTHPCLNISTQSYLERGLDLFGKKTQSTWNNQWISNMLKK